MKTYLASHAPEFNYDDPAPKGIDLTLLTIGNKQVTGHWTDDGRYKAWAPLLKRDKVRERELGYL